MASLPVVNQPARHSAALLQHLARRMGVLGEAALAPLGLRPRHVIALTVLRDADGMTQAALSETLQMDRTNLVGLLNELEGEGLVARTRSPEDRRKHVVTLTGEGRDMLARAEMALGAAEDVVLVGLTGKERETLHTLLSRAMAAHTGAACAPGGGAPAC